MKLTEYQAETQRRFRKAAEDEKHYTQLAQDLRAKALQAADLKSIYGAILKSEGVNPDQAVISAEAPAKPAPEHESRY